MENLKKLKGLLIDVFLLTPEEFSFDLKQSEIETWDSLGVVALAVGIEETFGYHMKPEEVATLKNIEELINLLESKGFSFNG